jgi:hypothetical protein
MSNIETGGPAFPAEVWAPDGVPEHSEGMTLRDYMAVHIKIHDDVKTQAYEGVMGQPFPSYAQSIDRVRWMAEAEAKLRYLKADAIASKQGANHEMPSMR